MSVCIRVFTDGSANNIKQKKGGIGIYYESKEYHKHNISKIIEEPKCTNNKMELQACISAINNTVKIMDGKMKKWKLIIVSDSMYVINAMTNPSHAQSWIQYGWKKPTKGAIENLNRIKELFTLSCTLDVTYMHVNSHKKEPTSKNSEEWKLWYGNKMADNFAGIWKDDE